MLECLILGDSIGTGIAIARPDCIAYVKSGINSHQWNNTNTTRDLSASTVIISLGSNDAYSVHTFKELLEIRDRVTATRVFWILPANSDAVREQVEIIAKNYKDIVLDTRKVGLSKDKVHPTAAGYKELGQKTR
jgi:lysophospholipase L1-like esterase